MYFKSTIIIIILLINPILAQSENLDVDDSTNEKSVRGAFGAVTIDGKIWNQIALRPSLPFGKLSISFDIVLYIDQDGNIHDDEWDFSSGEKVKNTLIDKVYYVRYGNKWQKNYFQIGALNNVTMGYGILLNNYTNTLLYPQVRKVGMEFKSLAFGVNTYGFTNDFKENFGLTGIRVSAPISNSFTLGISWAGDRNQYLGLRDSDNDGAPDLVDDFPYDKNWSVDTDGDGLADGLDNEWDIDGDGITDTLDSSIPGWNLDTVVVLDENIVRKPEPINIKKETESFQSFALDLGVPVFSEGGINISAYAQYAALLGKTINPIDTTSINAGYGLIPLGLSASFGPAKFNFELRWVPKGKFQFGYFNKSYEIERATFKSISGNQGEIVTKASKLGTYGKQNGFYSSLTLDLGSIFDARMAFQSLNGEQYNANENSFQPEANRSFTTILKLKKSISKIEKASWFYQQRNVPNPFNFEYSESTIMGYNVGLNLGNGMVLTYVFRRSFNDLNGDGDVLDSNEMINMTSVETSFSF
tara:strand:- start:2223 stop:3809 length:1587 start_codon:yes stop_codon:yes gene_type:complete